MTYVFRMRQTCDRRGAIDHVECEWGGQTFKASSTHGAIMAVARCLVSASAPDGPWEGVDSRTGRKRLYGRSVHALAGLTLTEPDRGGLKLVRWRQRPVMQWQLEDVN